MSKEDRFEVEIENIKERQKEESDKQERYRVDVHNRLTKVHDMFITSLDKISEQRSDDMRRIDTLENNMKNQSELISEFKKVVKELTIAVHSIKEYIDANKVRSSFKVTVFKYLCQLTALAATMIAVLNYMGK